MLDGAYQEALPLINQSIVLDPLNAWAYRNKGYYYLKTGHPDEAIRLLNRAVEDDPAVENGYAWLAEAYAEKGEHEMSCKALAQAVERKQVSRDEYNERCK